MPSHSLDVLARLAPRVPDRIVQRAAAWTAGSPVAVPRTAASVVLLRAAGAVSIPGGTPPKPREIGVETYLLHRHARMAFAASMVVFPGGGLDPADRSAGDPIRRCAVRETEEETGVRLDDAALLLWAHWVTPEIEPRRYDTYFFLAELPEGQQADDRSGETDRAEWSTPDAALAAERAGQIALMPPTLSILLELSELGSLAAIRQAATERVVERVLPQLVQGADGWQFRYPGRGRGGQP
jgi:8-oxo-dGTP pyrophosphatase MutT (NUDIX family)